MLVWCALEMDWMSKFTYPQMRIRMRIPACEAPDANACARRSADMDTYVNTSY